ncbi:class I SAM-dependent methyltransferase [Nakamurella sp.]|uniref:class I SAM-dependent methyltransferase n=1 Tax=Nakamurella sp. TaxID=1869182 RepID=UPI003784DA5E
MSFEVAAQSYGLFMGRYSEPLATELTALMSLSPGWRALDVGCGPGALTARLVDRLGAGSVAAVDPSAPFVAAARERFPDLDVRQGAAEALPWPDDSFDVVAASLVVHFMRDPVAGLREMGRVARPGGTVAATVWDHAGDRGPISPFWRAVRSLDPAAPDESDLAGARAGQLAALFRRAGLEVIWDTALTVRVRYSSADQWWEPYTLGVGPAGAYAAGLTAERREALRRQCLVQLPPAPFDIDASAWCVIGRA